MDYAATAGYIGTVIGAGIAAWQARRAAKSSNRAATSADKAHKQVSPSQNGEHTLAGRVSDIDHQLSLLSDRVEVNMGEIRANYAEIMAMFASHISDGHDPIHTRRNRRAGDPKS